MHSARAYFAFLFVACVCIPAMVLAQNKVGVIEQGGTGCPAGTVHVTSTPDKQQFTVLFDKYVASVQKGQTLDRKSCNFAIPVKVDQGFQVQLFKVDYRGFASIPPGGKGKFTAEYFFAGQKGPSTAKDFKGGFQDNFLQTDNVVATSLVFSPCGKDVILRANTNALAQKSNANQQEDATVAIDSVDVSRRIIYYFRWRRCPAGSSGAEQEVKSVNMTG